MTDFKVGDRVVVNTRMWDVHVHGLMGKKKFILPKSFLEREERDRLHMDLDPLAPEVAQKDHSQKWPDIKVIGIKKLDNGLPVLIAEGVTTLSERTYVSISQWNEETPWWHEGKVSKRLLRTLMSLPDYYQEFLPEADFSLEDIHKAQELVNGA